MDKKLNMKSLSSSSLYSSYEDIKSLNKSVKGMIFNSLTTAFLFGYSLTSINPVKNVISIEFGWCVGDSSLEDGGLVTGCGLSLRNGSLITVGVLVGSVIGSIVGGKLVAHGRRYAIILSHLVYFIGNLMSCISEGVVTLTASRIILGIGIGICAYSTPCYISEMTRKEKRGLYGVLFQLFITIGIMCANLLGLLIGNTPTTFNEALLSKDSTIMEALSIETINGNDILTTFQHVWWRLLLGLPCLVSIVSLIFHIYIYNVETPHMLLIRGDDKGCISLLRTINEKHNVEEEYLTIVDAIDKAKEVESISLPIHKALSYSLYRPVILIGFTLSAFQQFTGINLLITNSNRLFASIGLSVSLQLYLSLALTLVNVIMTFPPIFIIDRLGRRTLLLGSILGMTVFLFPPFVSNLINPHAEYTAYISAVCTFLFIISFAIGYGPIPYVFLHEIFPIEIKESASSFSMAFNWLASIIIVAPSDYLLSNNSSYMFTILFFLNIVASIFIFFFIKETKGISIDRSPYFKNKFQTKLTST